MTPDLGNVSGETPREAEPPLPEGLQYLLAPARRYGAEYPFEEDFDRFCRDATDEDWESLAALAEKMRSSGHYEILFPWLTEGAKRGLQDAEDVSALLGLMDAADMKFSDAQQPVVEQNTSQEARRISKPLAAIIGKPLRWERVPDEFHYLRKVVEACGETRVFPYDPIQQRHLTFVDRATDEQLALLERAFVEIQRRDHVKPLLAWLVRAEQGRPSEKAVSWLIRGLHCVFAELAEKGVEPFASGIDAWD